MFIKLLQEWNGKAAGECLHMDDAAARNLITLGQAEPADNPFAPLITEIKDLRTTLTALKASPNRPPFALATDPDADPKAGFKHFGEFAQAVKNASVPGARPDDRLMNLQTRAVSGLGETFSADGGFLVPPEFSNRLFERVYTTDSLLARTDSYRISSNGMAFPRNAESSRATGSRKGGIRGYWMDEGGQITASKPTFGRLQLTLHKLAVLCYVTEELMADSAVALDQYLMSAAVEEINFLLGDAILNGGGAGLPLGILTAPCTVSVAKETGQSAATLLTENIVKMWARLYGPCRKNAVWLINQDVEPQLLTMTLGVGTGGQVTYLPPGGLSDKPYATLLGRPVIPCEWCATLGTVGDIILADLSQYVTITRGRVEAAMSMHLRFDYDELAFRFILRVDGAPWWAAALTPFKGTATQSPFVTLATRS